MTDIFYKGLRAFRMSPIAGVKWPQLKRWTPDLENS